MIETLTPRLTRRPRDARGYVIPYVQFISADGVPDFRVLDHAKAEHALRNRRCSICGEPMGRHIYFIGGPLCVENGYFYDPPMHRECAEYSLRTCPHLARAKGKYSAPITRDADKENVVLVVGDMKLDKPDHFALMHGHEYTFSRMASQMLLIKATLPWVEVIRWREGSALSTGVGHDHD